MDPQHLQQQQQQKLQPLCLLRCTCPDQHQQLQVQQDAGLNLVSAQSFCCQLCQHARQRLTALLALLSMLLPPLLLPLWLLQHHCPRQLLRVCLQHHCPRQLLRVCLQHWAPQLQQLC
jgi:hypothetical protein